jgi:ectoine hydroxylase-related dioxygenase (phytanoyl-CoA dioxygenase family)
LTNDTAQRAAAAATPDLVTAFQRDGAVCLRGLLNADELMQLRRGIDANLAAPSPRAIVASQPDDPGFFIEDFCNWQDNPDYRALACGSPLAQVAARLMGSRTVRLYHDHMLTKEPGTRQKTPWHQDQPYYNVDGAQNVSFWIPADPVARPSTLEFVAGSHRGPWLMPRTFMTHQARWFPEGSLAELPDIEADRAAHTVLGWALQPGDVVAFHMLALHAAGGVAPGQRRRVFSLRYLGDDARHAPRRWATSPDFPGLADVLPAGAPMDHTLFPLLVGGVP